MNIFVGNLSFAAKEIDLQKLFANFGTVTLASIVMEKKGGKSRGFGFVEMPDEEAAKRAIAGLQGKEILGRPINVMEAVSKGPKEPKLKGTEALPGSARRVFSRRESRVIQSGSKYKQGRRSLSYLKKRGQDAFPREQLRKFKPNPLRWRKKSKWDAPSAGSGARFNKPWQKPQAQPGAWKKPAFGSGGRDNKAEAKPWIKSQGEARPWGKPQGESRPWIKSQTEAKPWKRSPAEAKPWKRSSAEAKPWIKSQNEAKPWKRSSAEIKPWKKSSGEAGPWKSKNRADSAGKGQSSRPAWKKKPAGKTPWRKNPVGGRPGLKKTKAFSRK